MKQTRTRLCEMAVFGALGAWLAFAGGVSCAPTEPPAEEASMSDTNVVRKTDEEWQKILTPEQYRVTRQKGTERPGSGEYEHFTGTGVYACVCCGQTLFASDAKFDSGCGWPSFSKPLDDENVKEVADSSFGMQRTETVCSRCGAHLGHVFPDGPKPTGLRYCINSVSLKFTEGEAKKH